MKYYTILAITFALASCNSNKPGSNQLISDEGKQMCSIYPPLVDSLHLMRLFDSAKWHIYALSCDVDYFPRNDSTKIIPFGYLSLRFESLLVKGDTVEFNFYFMDGKQPILPSLTRDTKELLTGVGFDVRTGRKIYMISPNGYSYYEMGGVSRYENPFQPEVLNFIKRNWDNIDPCFRDLAVRIGIKY